MKEVLDTETPNAVLFSSSLQYLLEPLLTSREATDYQAAYMVVDRIPFIAGDASLISLQRISNSIVASRYLVRPFNDAQPRAVLNEQYFQISSFDSVDGNIGRRRLTATSTGMVFRKHQGGDEL